MKNEQIKKIIFPVQNDLDTFEKRLEEIINHDDNFLKDDLHGFMFSNPKRLRPIFVFLFSKILNINSIQTLNIALVCELIHGASLMHDDIIDEEKLRRQNSTFFHKFGSKIALLEGDLLLSMALFVLGDTNIEIVRIFSQKIKKTILGELKQNSSLYKITDEKTYLAKTFDKTGNIFMAGLKSLFTLNEFDKCTKDSLVNFLKNYCLAFQIKNDIDNIKYNSASDIKNGNYTLVMLYFLMENNESEFSLEQNLDKYINKAYEKVDFFRKEALLYLNKLENTESLRALRELANLTLRS